MPQWLTTIVSSILPSLIVGVCTAIFSVRLALRRFHAERWWERKAEAYSRIVEALYNAVEYWSAQSDANMRGERLSEQREKELVEGYEQAYRELKKATAVGAYIISDEVVMVLDALEGRPRLDPKKCAWFEVSDAECEAYSKALAEVRKLAKKDLGV